jgi:hypothetical protein
MKLNIRIHNLKVLIPEPVVNRDGDYICITEKYPAYLLIGLNEWFSDTEEIRIPLDCYANGSTHEFKASLPFESKLYMDNPYVACLIVSLMIPVASKKGRLSPQRHAKQIVAYIDQMARYKCTGFFPVKLHNILCPDEYLCKFDVEVVSIICPKLNGEYEKFFRSLNSSQCDKQREILRRELEEETKYCKKQLGDISSEWKWLDKGSEECNVEETHNIFGARPMSCFLFMRILPTNERYWLYILDYNIMLKKTEAGVPLDCDSSKFFWELDVFEQNAIMEDMMVTPSVNAIYQKDAALRPNGKLQNGIDDHSTNINEGGVDCEDLEEGIDYCSATFQSSPRFENPILETLRRRSFKYQKVFVSALLNKSAPGKKPNPQFHATSITLHMKLLFDWIQMDLEKSSELSEEISRLREIEEHAGNLETTEYDPNLKKKVQLPSVFLGEGTSFMYPYDTEFHIPPVAIKEKENRMVFADLNGFEGWRRRSYQTKSFKLILRVFSVFTRYFIDHPIYPVNIPSLHFSSRFEGKLTMEKGVPMRYLMAYNLKSDEIRREVLQGFEPVLLPSSRLRDLKKSTQIMKLASMDKFSFCPLWRFKNGEIKSRIKEGCIITPPNLYPCDRVPDCVPTDTKNLYWISIPSGRYHEFRSRVDKKYIAGWKLVVIWHHIEIYVFWIRIPCKE